MTDRLDARTSANADSTLIDRRVALIAEELLKGFRATQAIYAAVELGIPDIVAACSPTPLEELQSRVVADADALGRLVRALVTLGILFDHDGSYLLTDVGECFRTDVLYSLAPEARLCGSALYAAYGRLVDAVRTGVPAYEHEFGLGLFEHLEHDTAYGREWSLAMHLGGQLGPDPLEGYNLDRHRLVVDVGGGYGTRLIPILRSAPKVRGVLFDRATVLRGAVRLFESEGILDRVELVAGDVFEQVPMGGDLYLLALVLHDWDDESCLRILHNVRTAIEPDGCLVILEGILPGSGPSPLAIRDLTMLVVTGGRERTREEFEQLLTAANFSIHEIVGNCEDLARIEATPC